jgi:hypothetical protein
MLGAYKIALIHLYKTQLAHYSLNTLHISSTGIIFCIKLSVSSYNADTVVLCNLVDDFCHMTISEEPLGTNSCSLTYLFLNVSL